MFQGNLASRHILFFWFNHTDESCFSGFTIAETTGCPVPTVRTTLSGVQKYNPKDIPHGKHPKTKLRVQTSMRHISNFVD